MFYEAVCCCLVDLGSSCGVWMNLTSKVEQSETYVLEALLRSLSFQSTVVHDPSRSICDEYDVRRDDIGTYQFSYNRMSFRIDPSRL